MQRFVIEKFPNELKFKHEDLNLQSEDVLQLVSDKCEKAALGYYITVRSNPSRSEMNAEVYADWPTTRTRSPLIEQQPLTNLSASNPGSDKGTGENS